MSRPQLMISRNVWRPNIMASPAIVATTEVTGRTVSGPKYPKRMIAVIMRDTFLEMWSGNLGRTGHTHVAGTVISRGVNHRDRVPHRPAVGRRSRALIRDRDGARAGGQGRPSQLRGVR